MPSLPPLPVCVEHGYELRADPSLPALRVTVMIDHRDHLFSACHPAPDWLKVARKEFCTAYLCSRISSILDETMASDMVHMPSDERACLDGPPSVGILNVDYAAVVDIRPGSAMNDNLTRRPCLLRGLWHPIISSCPLTLQMRWQLSSTLCTSPASRSFADDTHTSC